MASCGPGKWTFSLIQNSFCAMVLYGCVCPWRLALQKEGWRQQMDEIRAIRTVKQLCLLFRGPKNGAKNPPQKQGRSIPGRRKGFGLDKASPSFTVCMYVCNVMYVSMYVCNVCMYVCMCVCMYVMYVCIYIY